MAARYSYDPYGKATVIYTNGDAIDNTILYAGYTYDAATGLYFDRARYYDPQLGRFISQDPLGPAGSGDNLYAYCGENPLTATDPSGTTPEPMPSPLFPHLPVNNPPPETLPSWVDPLKGVSPTGGQPAHLRRSISRPNFRPNGIQIRFPWIRSRVLCLALSPALSVFPAVFGLCAAVAPREKTAPPQPVLTHWFSYKLAKIGIAPIDSLLSEDWVQNIINNGGEFRFQKNGKTYFITGTQDGGYGIIQVGSAAIDTVCTNGQPTIGVRGATDANGASAPRST